MLNVKDILTFVNECNITTEEYPIWTDLKQDPASKGIFMLSHKNPGNVDFEKVLTLLKMEDEYHILAKNLVDQHLEWFDVQDEPHKYIPGACSIVARINTDDPSCTVVKLTTGLETEVSSIHAIDKEIHLYDDVFSVESSKLLSSSRSARCLCRGHGDEILIKAKKLAVVKEDKYVNSEATTTLTLCVEKKSPKRSITYEFTVDVSSEEKILSHRLDVCSKSDKKVLHHQTAVKNGSLHTNVSLKSFTGNDDATLETYVTVKDGEGNSEAGNLCATKAVLIWDTTFKTEEYPYFYLHKPKCFWSQKTGCMSLQELEKDIEGKSRNSTFLVTVYRFLDALETDNYDVFKEFEWIDEQ